jgi:hypothetical protein
MPRRTDISSILIIGAGPAPSPLRGEGWGEGGLSSRVIAGAEPPHAALSPRGRGLFGAVSGEQEFLADGFEDAVGVPEHVVVPEANHSVAVVFDECGPGRVAFDAVLPAVQLDRQPGRSAGEVGHVIADLELADELLALELTDAEALPEARLRLSPVSAQSARDGRQAFPSQLGTPSPNPLPHGERAFSPSLSQMLKHADITRIRRMDPAPSPRRGEGWGEGGLSPRVISDLPPHEISALEANHAQAN